MPRLEGPLFGESHQITIYNTPEVQFYVSCSGMVLFFSISYHEQALDDQRLFSNFINIKIGNKILKKALNQWPISVICF